MNKLYFVRAEWDSDAEVWVSSSEDVPGLVTRAVEVFEDEQAALSWLKNPNAALGASSPRSLLDTELGSLAVSNTLGRIEHGVFA